MYIATIPFKERFEIIEESNGNRLLFDKVSKDYTVQTSTDIYVNYPLKAAKELFKKLV